MKMTLFAVITLMLSATLSEVNGDFDQPTQCDSFLLSRLNLLSRNYRENENEEVMIEYYASMELSKMNVIIFNRPRTTADYYIIHNQQNVNALGCHPPSDLRDRRRFTFNNYVLLPQYPTPEQVNALDTLSQQCSRRLPPQYFKYIAGYLGQPPRQEDEGTIIKRKLIVMPVPACANHPNNNIDKQTLNRINIFIHKFQEPFDMYANGRPEVQQYAVLYYGSDITSAKPPYPLFDRHRRIAEGDGWVAAIPEHQNDVRPQKPRHAEDVILSRVQCKKTQNRDIYLFTKFSPCRGCAELILNFAKQCSRYYRSFTVFYQDQWRDCLQSSSYIKGDQSYKNLKMEFFQVHLGNVEAEENYFNDNDMDEVQ